MSATAIPDALVVRPHSIPSVLRERRQWVAWCWAWRDSMNGTANKWTKVPIDVRTGRHAQSDNPDTWADFDTARAYAETRTNIAGIGYVFSADDPFAGIAFDHCREEETGELDSWAAAVLAGFDSYAEVSPSGTGVKCIVRATLLGGGIRRQRPASLPGGMVEMYDRGRFFTLTGHHVQTSPAVIHEAQAATDTLYARLTERSESATKVTSNGHHGGHVACNTLSDEDLIALASKSKNGPKFSALWMGDASAYVSHSEADLALCSLLAFYTGPDTARIDQLFRRSLLMRPKWDERHGAETYGASTVRAALDRRTEYWKPSERDATRREGPVSHPTAFNDEDGETWIQPANPWPEPLAEEAYHGLAGDFVRLIEPHTEADPGAILGQFLVLAGNCMGRSSYFPVEGDRHHPNLNLVTVGDTSSGRKGVALSRARQPFAIADEKWEQTRVKGGLSSAEGLIWQVRDPIKKWEKDKGMNALTEVEIDPGATDKRFLATETEFAGVLRQFQRDGNTLSNLIRDAFDRGNLEALTKNSPARATGAHISIIGHITKDELLRYLDTTEAANGLGNRFIWLCVKRSKFLPDGGGEFDLSPIAQRLEKALETARQGGKMIRDDGAHAMWHAVYRPLTEGKPGLLGAMLARAAPIVVRLSMIYALLDCSTAIRAEHLAAALAVWDYAEASVRYIFGDALGDPVADSILDAIRRNPNGITRTRISEVLGRNQKADRITRALNLLVRNNLARCEQRGGGQGEGRPVEWWFPASPGDRSSISSTS